MARAWGWPGPGACWEPGYFSEPKRGQQIADTTQAWDFPVVSGIPWEASAWCRGTLRAISVGHNPVPDLHVALSQPWSFMCGAAPSAWGLQQLGFASQSPQYNAPHPSPGNNGQVRPQASKYKITQPPPLAVRASPGPQHAPDRGLQPRLGPLHRGSPGSTGAGRCRGVAGTGIRH